MLPALETIVSRLRMRQLRLLIALDESGSIHKAAERVAISQPGATRALSEIEATLGVTLFTRSARGLTPNDLGRCVVRYAHLIHNDLAHLREEMAGILQGHGGRLVIGGIMGAIPAIVNSTVILRETQPTLSLEMVEATSARLLHLLDQRRVDLALCRASVSQRPDDYCRQALFAERLSVVAHRDHPLAGAGEITLGQLAHDQWIVYPVNMPMRRLLEREFSDAGLVFPGALIETASTFATLLMLERHVDMVALMPEEIALMREVRGEVKRLDCRLCTPSQPYEVVWRDDHELSPAARHFIDIIMTQGALIKSDCPPPSNTAVDPLC